MFQRPNQYPGYTIVEKLDSSRLYERYLAQEDGRSNRWVIIWSLSSELAHTAELRLCVQDASRHVARVKVDGVFEIYEIGTSESHGIYCVFPYDFPIVTFADLLVLSQSGELTLTPAHYASILLDAIKVIDAAYSIDLQHFALDPNHIFIAPSGDIYVAGFVESAMRRRFKMPTDFAPKLDAPEWRRHEQANLGSDVYAVGAMLYQSITGAFQPDEWEPRWMGMMDDLDRAHIPGDSLVAANSFFQRSLAERSQQRFPSYAAFITALEQLITEFGAYHPRELRAEALAKFYPPYPPVIEVAPENSLHGYVQELKKEDAYAIELKSDVISLISSDYSCVLPELAASNSSAPKLSGLTDSEDRAAVTPLDETATTPSQEGNETRLLYRSSTGLRSINLNLRSNIPISPLEILSRSRYQILDELGSGGTGTVYKVLDTTLSEVLALKVLRPDLVTDSAWLQRFKRELRITRDLEHPYILPAYHLEQLEGLYFFTMRYVDGKNLSQLLHEGPIPLMQALRILAQVGRALVAAHDRDIIHRDFKPANIMLESASLHPYLMDFGIASAPDNPNLTLAGQGIGTPYYMAPEQSRGDVITNKADIYSYGVVCYEALTKQLPFNGSTTVAIYTAQLSGVFQPLRELNPSVPEGLAKLIESCIQAKAADRPSSMRAVLDEFSRLQ